MNSGICTATPSTSCLRPHTGGGNADLLAKTFARTFALPLSSRIQCPSAFKCGMLQDFDFLCSNSLFRRHQSLEYRGKPRMRSRRLCLYATNAPCSTSLQARDSSANSRVPAAAVFAATAAKHVASSHGCEDTFVRIIFRGMLLLHISCMASQKRRTEASGSRSSSSAV